MTGYIDYTNLNQELQDLINQGGGAPPQGTVLSVNGRQPDATGDVQTRFIFLDEGDVNAPISEFPEGTSAFLAPNMEVLNVVEQNGMTMPPMLMTRDASSIMKVLTFKDSAKGVYTQEFQAAVDGIYETRYYRNGDGTNWEQLQEHRIIRSIDGQQADENGNVITSFRTIDTVRLDVPPSFFERGISEFYATFLASDYVDYIAENPSLSELNDGRIAVRTHVYPGITTYQEIDNIQDFVFVGQYFRIKLDNEDKWSELMKRGNGAVTEINGIRPDQSGSITLPTASNTTVGLVKPDGITITASADGTLTATSGGGGSTTPLSDDYELNDSATAASTKATKDLYDALNTVISDLDTSTQDIETNITNLQGRVNTITPLVNNINNRLNTHEGKIATETELGHVKIDGSTITINAEGVISANAGGSVTPTVVVDNLESTSTVDALSANQGRELKNQLDTHKAKVATATEIGQVKPDNITTFVNVDGTIIAVAPPSTWGSF